MTPEWEVRLLSGQDTSLCAGDVARLVESLPSAHETLDPSPAPYKLGVGTMCCNPSTQEGEAGGSEVQGHRSLHIKLEATLGCIEILSPNKQSCLVVLAFNLSTGEAESGALSVRSRPAWSI